MRMKMPTENYDEGFEWIVAEKLKKKILTPGNGPTATNNSNVTVHYTGRLLDGSKFDSSVDRNEPFKFKLGAGSVIKGWDVGVATMAVGEKALLWIEAEYGYGARGSPPKIPGGAPLVFEVELISFDDTEEVTQDGGVKKKVMWAGTGYQKCSNGSKVKINITAEFNGSNDGNRVSFMTGENIEYTVGDDVGGISGIDEALESMKEKEKASFVIKPNYAYGAKGLELGAVPKDSHLPVPGVAIPPNATLHVTIELLELTRQKEAWQMGDAEKREYCIRQREVGNVFFKAGLLERARSKYDRALSFVPDSDKSELNIPILNNLALILFKQANSNACIEKCNEALEIDRENVKALFRRGMAFAADMEFNSAEEDIRQAIDLDKTKGGNAHLEMARELARIRKRIADQKQKERKAFQGMFNRVSLVDENEKSTDNEKANIENETMEDADVNA